MDIKVNLSTGRQTLAAKESREAPIQSICCTCVRIDFLGTNPGTEIRPGLCCTLTELCRWSDPEEPIGQVGKDSYAPLM